MTLMQDVKSGITDEIKQIATIEGVDPEFLRKKVVNGHVVIPRNPIHNRNLT